MNLALDHFADNPIIDELVLWPPRKRRIESIRACCPMFRKPFIEVAVEGGEVFHRHFMRDNFANFWAEACVILEILTAIELVSDFRFVANTDPEKLRRQVIETRDECIAESELMFDQGMYEQFLMQYGEDCKNLPAETLRKIDDAWEKLGQPA